MKAGWRTRDICSLLYSLSCTICFQIYISLSVFPFACFCLYVQPVWPVQLGTSTQNCLTLQSHHARPWPSMFPPKSPSQKLFLMGTVLHLLRSCIAGRGLWGKPFNGEIIPDGNTLVAALNSLKVRRSDCCVKAGWRARDNLSLAKVASKYNALVLHSHSVPLLFAPLQIDDCS